MAHYSLRHWHFFHFLLVCHYYRCFNLPCLPKCCYFVCFFCHHYCCSLLTLDLLFACLQAMFHAVSRTSNECCILVTWGKCIACCCCLIHKLILILFQNEISEKKWWKFEYFFICFRSELGYVTPHLLISTQTCYELRKIIIKTCDSVF